MYLDESDLKQQIIFWVFTASWWIASSTNFCQMLEEHFKPALLFWRVNTLPDILKQDTTPSSGLQ